MLHPNQQLIWQPTADRANVYATALGILSINHIHRGRENQRISMRTNLGNLDILWSHLNNKYNGEMERENQRMSMRNLCLEFL